MEFVDHENNAATLTELLSTRAVASPDRCAVVFEEARLSYGELENTVKRAATGLSNLGVTRGTRVAFWLPNTVDYVVLYFACAQLGAIAVGINTRFRSKEVADLLERSGARVLVVWPQFRGIDFMAILDAIPARATDTLSEIIACGGSKALPRGLCDRRITLYSELIDADEREIVDGDTDDGCNIFTTSGTTSLPKLVLHTQRSIARHAEEMARNLAPVIRNGAVIQLLPFCGVFGFVTMILSVARGCTMVVMSSFEPRTAVALMDTHNVRYLNATDDMLFALLDADTREHALPSLVCCGFGAFNTPPEEVALRASRRGVSVVGLYGMSEVLALFSRRDHHEPRDQVFLGGGTLVSPQATIRARNPDTGELQPHGEAGELEARGPSLMREYFGDLASTTAVFTDDGYFRTGDLGYTTSDRSFVYLTRLGDSLRLGGFLVNPAEIEAHLCEHRDVANAQVVAVRIGDVSRAFAFVIGRREHIDLDSLRAHCDGALAAFKNPVAFSIVDEFPTTKSANGTKIQRAKLRDMAAKAVAEQ